MLSWICVPRHHYSFLASCSGNDMGIHVYLLIYFSFIKPKQNKHDRKCCVILVLLHIRQHQRWRLWLSHTWLTTNWISACLWMWYEFKLSFFFFFSDSIKSPLIILSKMWSPGLSKIWFGLDAQYCRLSLWLQRCILYSGTSHTAVAVIIGFSLIYRFHF